MIVPVIFVAALLAPSTAVRTAMPSALRAFAPPAADTHDMVAWHVEYVGASDSVRVGAAKAAIRQPKGDAPGTLSALRDVSDERADRGLLHPVPSMMLNMASLATLAVNIKSPSHTSAWFGLAAGLTSVIAGSKQLSQNRTAPAYPIANVVTGAGAATVAVLRLLRPGTPARGQGAAADAAPNRTHVTPIVVLAGDHPRLGLMLQRGFR